MINITEGMPIFKENASSVIKSKPEVHALQQLDFFGMMMLSIQGSIKGFLSSIDYVRIDTTFKILKCVDQILNTRLHDAAIVEHHAKGLTMSQPDAFLEQFSKLPGEIFDKVFVNLPAQQIPSLKRVCQSWNQIIEGRRYKYPKIHHGRVEIHMGEEISSITSGVDCVFGLFGAGKKRNMPLYFSHVSSHININTLEINIHSEIPMLSTLSLSTTSIEHLHVRFHQMPERSVLEELSELISLNKEILSVRLTFPRGVLPSESAAISEMFTFEDRNIRVVIKYWRLF